MHTYIISTKNNYWLKKKFVCYHVIFAILMCLHVYKPFQCVWVLHLLQYLIFPTSLRPYVEPTPGRIHVRCKSWLVKSD